jgi:hypothetical protein
VIVAALQSRRDSQGGRGGSDVFRRRRGFSRRGSGPSGLDIRLIGGLAAAALLGGFIYFTSVGAGIVPERTEVRVELPDAFAR